MAKRSTETPKQKLGVGRAELKQGAKRPSPPEPPAPLTKIQRAKQAATRSKRSKKS